jgi:hypothetical protein
MQPLPSASETEASHPTTAEGSALSKRSLLAVVGLVVLTVGSLGLAWVFPNQTLFHFLWVAQAVPVLYLFLAWWGTYSPHSKDDAL